MSFGGGGGGGASSLPGLSDVALSSPTNNQVLTYDSGTLKWINATSGTAPVSSVAGKTGAVTLVKADVGLGNVDNTTDLSKPVSTAVQAALNAKADEAITITGATSLTGGGDLSVNRTLSLVNDSATPGISKYYGTNGSGVKGYFDVTGGSSPTYANLPAGTTLTILKTSGTWPARPTSRTDIVVQWKGPDPSPAIVSSGTGGMLDNVDIRIITP